MSFEEEGKEKEGKTSQVDFIQFKIAFLMFVSNLLCLNAAWYNRKEKKKTITEILCKYPDLEKKNTLILTRASFFIFYTGEYFIQSKILK